MFLRLFTLLMVVSVMSACNQAPDDTVVATFEGGTVGQEEVDAQLQKLARYNKKFKDITFTELDANHQQEIVRELVAKKLIEQQARDAKTHKKEAIKRAVKDFENQLIQKEFLLSVGKEQADPKAVEEKYAILLKKLEGKKERKLRHILVETKGEAEKIRKQLINNKASFKSLAEKHSKDTFSAKKGGDLGYVLQGQMVSEFEEAAFTLKNPGDISPAVETEFGWHIILFEEERLAKAAPLEEVQEAIQQELIQQAITEYIEGQLKQAKIQIGVQ